MKKGIWGLLAALPLLVAAEPVTNVTWESSVQVAASYKSGNTDQTLFTGDWKAKRTAPLTEWLNLAHGEYGKTEGNQTEGQALLQSIYRYNFGTERWYAGLFGELLHDGIKDINFRATLGPNVGYYFIKNDTMKLDSNIGINAVYEARPNEVEETYAAWRWALNYEWQINEPVSYYFHVDYGTDVKDLNNGTGLLFTGLKNKMSEKLAMYIEFRDEYRSSQNDDSECNDITVLAGLSYDIL